MDYCVHAILVCTVRCGAAVLHSGLLVSLIRASEGLCTIHTRRAWLLYVDTSAQITQALCCLFLSVLFWRPRELNHESACGARSALCTVVERTIPCAITFLARGVPVAT